MKASKFSKSKTSTKAFVEWLNDYGSIRLAKELGIDRSTISHWRSGNAHPRVEHMRRIVELSKGQVTYDHIIDGGV